MQSFCVPSRATIRTLQKLCYYKRLNDAETAPKINSAAIHLNRAKQNKICPFRKSVRVNYSETLQNVK